MSKRKSLPIKLSLTNSDEESVKKNLGEFKVNESDFEDDNGVFEEDAATELNSETEDTDSPQQLGGSNLGESKRTQQALSSDKASSAMLNSLSQQAMKRKHKKFRPSESEENAENFTNNLNNGSNNNLSSLMSLAMGNNQSAYDLFALSSMGNGQLLNTLARFASANNHADQQPAAASKEQPTKNNGLFKRRKRSELEEDEDNEPKDDYNDLKATDQTASLLAAISNFQQPQSNSNEQLAQMVGQLAGGRKSSADTDAKHENDRKLIEVFKQLNDLKEKLMLNQSEVPNGNSLANGSAFNNLQLDIVSGYFFLFNSILCIMLGTSYFASS